MKLLFISTMGGAPWGGSETLWCGAAETALKRGDTVAVSVFDWSPTAPAVARLVDLGARLVPRARHVSRWSTLFSSPEFLREFDAFDPDTVCLSQGAAFECVGRRVTRPIAKWLARSKARLVNVIQYNAPTTLKPAVKRAARELFDRADVNAFVASRNLEQAAESVGAAVPRAQVLRNPVNLVSHEAMPFPGGNDLRLACVARLDARTKGQTRLIDALASDTWRSRSWSLSLFGSGPDETLIDQFITRRGLADRVFLRGQVSDIRSIWRDHHALVLASRAEGTPLAMVEAMLLGRPCVVTDVGGCAEWIREGSDGFLAKADDAHSVGAALERLWENRDRLEGMGISARSRALSLIDPDPTGSLLKLMSPTDPMLSPHA